MSKTWNDGKSKLTLELGVYEQGQLIVIRTDDEVSDESAYLTSTPTQAREIAAELIKMAEEIEAAEWEKTND